MVDLGQTLRTYVWGEGKNWERRDPAAVEWGRGSPCLQNTPLLTCNSVEFGRFTVTDTNVGKKLNPLRRAFRGHSSSPEPTRIDRIPMTSENSENLRPGVLNAPAERLQLEFSNTGWVQKLE